MAQLVRNLTSHQKGTMAVSEGPSTSVREAIVRDRPDAHWSLADPQCRDGETVVAACSLWWNNTPPYGDHRVGVIGHFSASNASTAQQILSIACAELRAHDCTLAVGPMDGNTWRPYRLVTEMGSEPSFFLEPSNPPDWPGHFRNHNFTTLAEYFSGLDDDLSRPDPLLQRVADQMLSQGIHIRKMALHNFDEDLRSIHSVASVSFRDNLLFSPIDERAFIDLFRPLKERVVCDFVLLAEHRGKPVGFLFAVPDYLQADRGEPIDTLIVKTLAILPMQQYAGLGYLMLHQTRLTVHRLGYTRMIKALVRDTAPLRRATFKDARPIRSYALFAKELRP